jgi:hypothetical protein
MKKEKYKVKKLDRRMAGNSIMKYHIDFSYPQQGYSKQDRMEEFYRVFRWCEGQYGVTRCLEDLKDAIDQKITAEDVNPNWTFIRDQWRVKILLAEKEQAAHYTLVWGI